MTLLGTGLGAWPELSTHPKISELQSIPYTKVGRVGWSFELYDELVHLVFVNEFNVVAAYHNPSHVFLTPLVLNVRNHAQNNNYKMSELESNLDNEEFGKPILI